MAAQEKVSVYSLAGMFDHNPPNLWKDPKLSNFILDLKNTTDDALPNYLNSLSFKQSHTLSDTRLALGYSAFAICAATFYWDYAYGFESTKLYTAVAVAIYTLLNGFLTFWIFYVEKGSVYIGSLPSGEKIAISSSTTKHKPLYQLKVTTWANKNAPGVTRKLEKEFRDWFDGKGHFVAQPFQEMLASNVTLVGKVDPKRVVSKKEKTEQVDDGKTMDEKWANLLAESTGVESNESVVPGKGKRRAKKWVRLL